MNAAKRTARKRRNLLKKGAQQDPKTLLGRWALKIWRQGTGYNKRQVDKAIVAAGKVEVSRYATDAEFKASSERVMSERKQSLKRLATS